MFDPPAAAGLIPPAGRTQRSATRLLGAALGAIDMAAIAMAADQHLHPAGQTKKQSAWQPSAMRMHRLML